jgi:hypothetical protein
VRANTFASITNRNMKTEDHAWRELQRHAAAQLRPAFADQVLRAARGPDAAAWAQLQNHAATQIRPGFAERVLRAARALPGVPSLFDQFAFSAATVALCVGTVVIAHTVHVQRENDRNIAGWQQLAADVRDFEQLNQ